MTVGYESSLHNVVLCQQTNLIIFSLFVCFFCFYQATTVVVVEPSGVTTQKMNQGAPPPEYPSIPRYK